MAHKIVIIGGVAGGASCAARLRRMNERAEIVLLERGKYISFANCGLPYHIGNVIENRDKLVLQTPESFRRRFRVDVRVNSNAIEIRRSAQTVLVECGGSVYKEAYDSLVLATGGSPIRPMLPGIDLENVMQLWNIPDMDRILAAIRGMRARSAVVVGGGFIGLEVAENLRHIGLEVAVLEKQNHVLPPLDFDMAQLVHEELVKSGVRLLLEEGVAGFEQLPTGGVRVLTEKRTMDADIVVLSIGVRPNSELAAAAKLATNARGCIVVDQHLRTSDSNIYAIGDVVEVEHFVDHARRSIPLAGPANKMGRIAADNICGIPEVYKGTQGSSIVKLFTITAAGTGLTQAQLEAEGKRLNREYRVNVLWSPSNASYYPDSRQFALKVLFGCDGKLLGAQAVGPKGVDKRMDVLATAIRLGADVRMLKELELCYAPPYSSAKDPVNMAGYAASNMLDGLVDIVTCEELPALENVTFLDVRTPAEANLGAIENSILIPLDELRERLDELDPDRHYVAYCAIGLRGYIASRILKQNGFPNVRNLAGGYLLYSKINARYGG